MWLTDKQGLPHARGNALRTKGAHRRACKSLGGGMEGYRFASARELFEAARDAAREAERARLQLEEIEARATSLGGGGFGPRVASTPDPDRMGWEAARRAELTERMQARIERDEALMDAASAVLYGSSYDGDGGIDSLLGTVYADAIHWHYLALEPWERVGRLLGYSGSRCRHMAQVAFDTMDALGVGNVLAGVGVAT